MIAALGDGVEAARSRVGAGFARTPAADKIGRLFRLRPASRTSEQIGRPALSPLALNVRDCVTCILKPAIG